MRSLSAATAAALAQPRVPLAQLVEMELSQPLYLNTSGWHLEWAGHTWLGAARVGRIDTIDDTPAEVAGLKFQLSGVPTSMLSLVLAEPVQGKPVNIYTAIFDADTRIVDAPLEWAGRLDVLNLVEQGESSVITVSAEHIGLDLTRPGTQRFSSQDQQRLYPGDRFFQYLVDTADRQIVWPAASFFRR